MKQKIDLDKFFTDPAHADEKEFLTGVIERHLTEKAAKKAEEDAKLPPAPEKTFLQSIFE